MDVAYCTAEDVRKVLQEVDLQGPLDESLVEPAITAQTEWIQLQTDRHWYTTEADPDPILATDPREIHEDNYNLPSTPYPRPNQIPSAEFRRHPFTIAGGYSRVRIQFRNVQEITKLLVRNGTDYTDWVADDSKEEGFGEDYYLQSDPKLGGTDLYIKASAMSPAEDWTDGVIVDYTYGIEGIPGSVRQLQACLAGADLVMDDDVKTAIPNDGQLIPIETKADRLIKQAKRLLKNYR